MVKPQILVLERPTARTTTVLSLPFSAWCKGKRSAAPPPSPEKDGVRVRCAGQVLLTLQVEQLGPGWVLCGGGA